jgi:hypothetical protein
MDYHVAIYHLAGGRAYECRGTYASIVCIGWAKPSDAELIAAYPIAVAAAELRASDLASKRDALTASVATMRAWADDAEDAVNNPAKWDVWTTAQRFAALKTTLSRLGVFFRRFADSIETR